jgi:peptidoglycan/LPS O-acetylase OafA/YrhL
VRDLMRGPRSAVIASDTRRLDALRGLACVLLVLFHVIGSDPSHGLRIAEGPLRLLNDGLTYLRLPLFTFLSGMVYGLRPFAGDSRGFLGGKARRLLVPMLFVGTLFALAQSFLPATNFGAEAGRDRNWLLLHVEPVAHFWFLEALFWIFLLTWALERGRLLATPGRLAAAWLLAAAVDVTASGPRWLAIDGACFLLPYFLGGLATSRLALVPQLGRAWARVLLIAAGALAIAQLGTPVPNPDRHTPWFLLAGISLCALCAGLRFEAPWLARIGTSSYTIYLFHVFFTAAARIVLDRAGLTPLPLQIVAGLAAGLLAPMLIERWAQRSAGLRLLLLGQPFRADPPPMPDPAARPG